MKVALLLIVVLVAAAEARYQPIDSRSDEDASEWRTRPPVNGQQPREDTSDSSEPQEAPPTELPCPEHCPLVFSPVCVRDSNGVYRSFPNDCMLRQCHCRTGFDYVIIPESVYRGTVKDCPKVWEPNPPWQLQEEADACE